ncbi:transposase [Streptomyces canus]
MAGATGAPWRDLPSGYGPWQTVYGLFRRWQRTPGALVAACRLRRTPR